MAMTLSGSADDVKKKTSLIYKNLSTVLDTTIPDDGNAANAAQALDNFLAQNQLNAANEAEALQKLHEKAAEKIFDRNWNVLWDVQKRALYLGHTTETPRGDSRQKATRELTAFAKAEGFQYLSAAEQVQKLYDYARIKPGKEPVLQTVISAGHTGQGQIEAIRNYEATQKSYREFLPELDQDIARNLLDLTHEKAAKIQGTLNLLGYAHKIPDGQWTRDDQVALNKFIAGKNIDGNLGKTGNQDSILAALDNEVDKRSGLDLKKQDIKISTGDTDPSSIREMQTYLNLFGYSQKMPTGVWTATDQDALQRFAADTNKGNKFDNNSKISANMQDSDNRQKIQFFMHKEAQRIIEKDASLPARLSGLSADDQFRAIRQQISLYTQSFTKKGQLPSQIQAAPQTPTPETPPAPASAETPVPSPETPPAPVPPSPTAAEVDPQERTERIQAYLKVLGYTDVGEADGDEGPKTLAALGQYAADRKIDLKGEGVNSEKVLSAIENDIKTADPRIVLARMKELKTGIDQGSASRTDIKELQHLLLANGGKLDRFGTDGLYGDETSAAFTAATTAVLAQIRSMPKDSTQVADIQLGRRRVLGSSFELAASGADTTPQDIRTDVVTDARYKPAVQGLNA